VTPNQAARAAIRTRRAIEAREDKLTSAETLPGTGRLQRQLSREIHQLEARSDEQLTALRELLALPPTGPGLSSAETDLYFPALSYADALAISDGTWC
jgi:hypothetical protein